MQQIVMRHQSDMWSHVICGDVVTVEINCAAAWLDRATQDVDQSRCARLRKPDHCGHRPRRCGEGQICQRLIAVDAQPHPTRLQRTGDADPIRRRRWDLLRGLLRQLSGRCGLVRPGLGPSRQQLLHRTGEPRGDHCPLRRRRRKGRRQIRLRLLRRWLKQQRRERCLQRRRRWRRHRPWRWRRHPRGWRWRC